MPGDVTAGDGRCWPCIVANALVGLAVGWVPFAAAVVRGRIAFVIASAVWAVGVTAYTGYRLLALGYLPFAEPVANRTGLQDRIGPGAEGEDADE